MTATSPDAVTRGGRAHPVAVLPLDRPVVDALRLDPTPATVDADLVRLGLAHLGRLRSANPALHDGAVLRWLRTEGDTLVVAEGSYFDMLATCDAVRAEGAVGPCRRAVLARAPDPSASGEGRCAALGVTVVLVRGSGAAETFLIGLRSARVATDVGRWHAFPSGMVEPDAPTAGGDAATGGGGQPLATTIAAELQEEVGVVVPAVTVCERGRVIGLAHDLTRLRPDVVVVLPVTEDEWAGRAGPSDPEMSEQRWVDLTRAGIADFWRDYPPKAVTPPLAGAVALLEHRLA